MPLAGKILNFPLGFLNESLDSHNFTSTAHEALQDLRPRLSEFYELRKTRLTELQ